MNHQDDFSTLIDGIKSHLTETSENAEEFLPCYEEALLFMELGKILPKNEFTRKRLALIGRDLALTIYFAMHHMCEEAQILLRQVLDLIYIIIYGANHVLELKLLDEGKIDQMGNVRADIERRLPPDMKGNVGGLYRKLSCVVHGTIRDILSQVISVKEGWESPSKLGHWKHDFHLTLHYGACLFRSWLPREYANLDISVRIELEKKFPDLRKLEKEKLLF